ncbi:MAG TPA: hypothetical protein VFI18_06410 [Gaiellales bacterium]|nr:hypothetical protein [Gaiellales bacterium]
MSRRMLVVLGLLGAAAVSLVAGIAAAEGGSSTHGLRAWGFGAGRGAPVSVPHIRRERRIQLRAQDFVATALDNDPVGSSQGDAIVVEGRLVSRRQDSTVGRLDVNEVFSAFTQNGGAHLVITATATLAGGQITAVGVGRVRASGQITIKLPIAGGTGKYRNARGVLIGRPHGAATRLVYLLIP